MKSPEAGSSNKQVVVTCTLQKHKSAVCVRKSLRIELGSSQKKVVLTLPVQKQRFAFQSPQATVTRNDFTATRHSSSSSSSKCFSILQRRQNGRVSL